MIQTKSGRIEAIDLARGIAVVLMILSHGVKGLLSFEQFPNWGLVPIHLVTKFSSTLFFLVFGITLAVAFVPLMDRPDWPQKRKRLFLRGLLILFWYKVLTIVEMMPQYSREQIMETLLYRAFTVYVEILGFYALALLWIPFALTLWRKLQLAAQLQVPLVFAIVSLYLYDHFHFWGSDELKALLVEHESYYTWGQLSRAPLVFSGLLIGELIRKTYFNTKKRLWTCFGLFALSGIFLFAFWFLSYEKWPESLYSIALNEGKHPPEASFMSFSIFGALFLLGLSFVGGERLPRILKPITIIGKDALNAFIFHIFVIFIFYRYLFDYWHKVSYHFALTLTIFLIVLTAAWIKLKDWVSKGT